TASAPVSLPSVPAPRLLRAALPLLIAAPVVLGVQAGGVWVLAQLAKPEPAASAPAATTAAPRTAAPLFASTSSSVPVLAKAPAAEAAAPPAPVISRAPTPEVPAGERPVPAASVEPGAGKPVTAAPAQAPAPGPDAGPVQAASAPEAPVARVEAVAPKPAPASADTADAAPPAVSPVSPTPPAVSPVTRPAASVLYVPPPYVPVAPYAVAAAQAPARIAVTPVAHPAGDKAPAPAPAGTEPERQELLGPDWVRAQPVNNRTLQLMAGSSLEVLREYVRSHDFADVPVAYIPSLRDGQPWYYLIAGSFASVQESSAAERVLKNVQSGLKPWTRRFGGMQALIKP
ncbi:MAG TPA: SPOR domain-containing protein, partial [Plasticicumulans sp.]|nr:SPOR domain-containing protein [Plasticicumulans sp.]